MSQYYRPHRSAKYCYQPGAKQPFKLSRSRLELFQSCPRCFYFDRRLGVDRPPSFPFSLNSAVDKLLKLEFDAHRVAGSQHPLLAKYGVDARPVPHEQLDNWRQNFVGIQYLHRPTNLLITGAIDDLWQNSQGEYIIVDYKSTSKGEQITALDQDWQGGYKRQMEIYQWLLRQNGYPVSKTGYFVYCNGLSDKQAFDAKLEFELTLIAYQGDDSWVKPLIKDAHQCLESGSLPKSGQACDYCAYREAVRKLE